MLTITKANEIDNLDADWNQCDMVHYGKRIKWLEKSFKFKAVENDTLIGLVEGKVESGTVYISGLITAEKARGRGTATMLIEKAEEFGKKHGAHRTWLVTGKEWSENTFYKKLGFQLIGELPDFYFHTDFVIYTREIV